MTTTAWPPSDPVLTVDQWRQKHGLQTCNQCGSLDYYVRHLNSGYWEHQCYCDDPESEAEDAAYTHKPEDI